MNKFYSTVAIAAILAVASPAFADQSSPTPKVGTEVEASSVLKGTATMPNKSDNKEISSQAGAPEVQVKQDASNADLSNEEAEGHKANVMSGSDEAEAKAAKEPYSNTAVTTDSPGTTAPASLVLNNGPATFLDARETGDIMASTLIGMRVYAVEADIDESKTYPAESRSNWEDVGEVNDVVLDWDGGIKAVLLGIGGLLGMGEKNVAIDMASLRRVREADDAQDWFLVVNASKASLAAAPGYTVTVN